MATNPIVPPSATDTDDGPQGLSKRCPDCMSRFIPENQGRCFPCAQVTLCGDPNCACAQEMEGCDDE